MPTDHVIDPAAIHHAWDRDLAPALTIASGDSVAVDVPMAGHGQVPREGAYADCAFDFDVLYHLAGPIAIEGAEPGHTLQVELLELIPGDWGWTVIMPDLGLLPDRFPAGYLRTFDLTGDAIAVAPGVAVPFSPFFGTLGTAPDRPGPLSPFPPHEGGGNMDNRHLTAGSTLWLPVHVPGALFSVGDPHAAQGDGEVCVSACECPMRATLRFTLLETPISAPSFRTAPARGPRSAEHATMGIAPDLMEGARIAVSAMIDWLVAEHGLTPEDAYVLCSLAGDLRIHELVDAGVFNVGMAMPLDVLPSLD